MSARLSIEPPAVAWVVEQAEGLGGDLEALQGRDVEVRDQQQQVGLVERLQHDVVEGRRGVDDDDVEALLEDAQDATDQLTLDPVLGVWLHRRDQHARDPGSAG